MTRPAAALVVLALGAGAAALLSACGGSDARLLPGRTADEINENLSAVQRLAAEGECVGAQDAALQVSDQVEQVQGIDRRLKQALEEGAARLNEVVAGCEEEAETSVEEAPRTTPSETTAERRKAEEEARREEQEAEKEAEKAEKEAEKEAEKAEKEAEKAEESEAPVEPGPPKGLPPQAKGEAKGHEEGPQPPSGGIGAGSEVGGGD